MSIVKNYHNLLAITTLLTPCVSIIAVSELWTIIENEILFDISGYNFIFQSRIRKAGGGVGLFLSNSYNYILRDDLLSHDVDIVERIFIEIITNNIVIGCIYRPPNIDIPLFTD